MCTNQIIDLDCCFSIFLGIITFFSVCLLTIQFEVVRVCFKLSVVSSVQLLCGLF